MFLELLATTMAVGVEPDPSQSVASKDCAECPELVPVTLPKGVTKANPIRRAFKFETTWAEYMRAVDEGACVTPTLLKGNLADPKDASLRDRVAVTGVSVDDAKCYANWLTKKTGKTYRLPTKAEWEAIARAGATTSYPWGNELGMNNAFVTGAYDWKHYPIASFRGPRSPSNIQTVGQLRPNALGMYDVIGNATELTATTEPLSEPCKIPRLGCAKIILKGVNFPGRDRLSDEAWTLPKIRDAGNGFRLVRE